MQVVPASSTVVAVVPAGARRRSLGFLRERVPSHQWPGRLLWLGLVVLHAVCAVYYTAMALVYLCLPSTILAVNLQAFQLTVDMKYFPLVAAFHLLFGAIHANFFLVMVGSSMWKRQFNFKLTGRHAIFQIGWIQVLVTLWQLVFGSLGIFGVDNPNFEAFFCLRELFETALQSYQAYRMSQYVPRVWLNNVWVVIISVSCWGTPLVQSVPRLRRRTRLLLALLCDILLDFTVSVGSPSVLALSYLAYYDFQAQDFNADAWYSDLWYVNMVNEFKLVFVQSWSDGLARIIAASSLLLCIDDIKILVSTVEPSASVRRSISKLSFTERPSIIIARRAVTKAGHRLLILWGFVLVALHIEASFNEAIPGCQLQVRPWASTETACSFLLIDCDDHVTEQQLVRSSSSANRIEAAWEHVNPSMLALVTIQNCPSLVIPPSVQQLHGLMGLNIVASTLTSWDATAALTKTHHPNLRHLGLLLVNFTNFGSGNGSVFPPGLVSPEFPPTLFDIFVWDCGWTDLPSDLDTIWPKRTNLLIPNNGMTHIPSVMLRMDPMRLMLDDNPLLELPSGLFLIPSLESVEASRTSLQSLPEVASGFPNDSKLRHFHVQATNISVLPAWITSGSFLNKVSLHAEETPLCASIQAGDLATVAISGHVVC